MWALMFSTVIVTANRNANKPGKSLLQGAAVTALLKQRAAVARAEQNGWHVIVFDCFPLQCYYCEAPYPTRKVALTFSRKVCKTHRMQQQRVAADP